MHLREIIKEIFFIRTNDGLSNMKKKIWKKDTFVKLNGMRGHTIRGPLSVVHGFSGFSAFCFYLIEGE